MDANEQSVAPYAAQPGDFIHYQSSDKWPSDFTPLVSGLREI